MTPGQCWVTGIGGGSEDFELDDCHPWTSEVLFWKHSNRASLAPADLQATEGTRRRQGIMSWPLEECTVGNAKLSLTGGL